MSNLDIRQKALASGVKLYKIAEALNITDGTLSKKLRKEFTSEEKEKVFLIIEQLAKENK